MTWTTVLVLLVLAILLAAAILIREQRALRREQAVLQLLQAFGPVGERAQDDPRQLLVWAPLALAARQLFPEAFRQLDAAAGGSFPFTREHVEAAHARWTADWLAWERSHDAEYKLKAAGAERALETADRPGAAEGRARLAVIEREKLERYQQRYEEYVRISKALAALAPTDRS